MAKTRTSFKKGQPKPPRSGRKSNTSNRVTKEIREFCREVLDSVTYRSAFKKRLIAGSLPPQLEALAWRWAFGDPPEVRTEVEQNVRYVVEINPVGGGISTRKVSPEEYEASKGRLAAEILDIQRRDAQEHPAPTSGVIASGAD